MALIVQQLFFTTFALAFGLLHFLLYYYNRKLKSQLFFSLFLLLFAINFFVDFQNAISSNFFVLRIHRGALPISQIFLLLFTYSIFEYKKSIIYWLICFGFLVTGILSIIHPTRFFNYMQIFMLLTMLEMGRVFVKANIEKKQNASIISTGFLFLLISSLYDMFMDINLIKPILGIVNGYPLGFLLMIIFMSIYLARDYAHKHLKMIEEERKSKELKEARELQQAMLPQSCDLHGFDNCFYMQPATEIGGDYYDYRQEDDGSLTIAMGDATGHGLKAGIMVAIIKSLFTSASSNMVFDRFFNTCSQTLRNMNLGNLYMAMILVRIKDNILTASSAGMPYILIHRAQSQTLEELEIKGMPLGATESFPYQTKQTRLNSGDTVLLMSDGIIELFNKDKQTLGEERIRELFCENAHLRAHEIIAKLVRAAKEWKGQAVQNDDITLIALKI